MSPRQARFVAEYLIDLNATQAAIRAGYSERTAGQQGFILLKNLEIAAAVSAKAEKALVKVGATADQVLMELARIALSDARLMFTPDGALLPPSKWPDDMAATVAGVETTTRRWGKGDSAAEITTTKIRRWDKPKALEVLAKYHGLLKNTLDVPQLADIAAALERKVVHELHPGPTKSPSTNVV